MKPSERRGAQKVRFQNRPYASADVANESWPLEILVVADGSGISPTLGTMLQSRGFQVILAPDPQTALEEIDHYDVAAVIVEAGREPERGLDLLAAAKERRAAVKTLMVTTLLHPVLPIRAYAMDIDDYLHWPLSGRALTARLCSLLSREAKGGSDRAPAAGLDQECSERQAAWEALVDGCVGLMARISQAVENLHTRFLPEMTPQLSAEMEKLTALLRNIKARLGDAVRQQEMARNPAGWRSCGCH